MIWIHLTTEYLLFTFLVVIGCHGYPWAEINLPLQHMPFFFKNNPHVKELCERDHLCPYKVNGDAIDRKVMFLLNCYELCRLLL